MCPSTTGIPAAPGGGEDHPEDSCGLQYVLDKVS